MLTKKQLLEQIRNKGISWKDKKGFQTTASDLILAEYGDVSEEILAKFLNSYCSKISIISKKFHTIKDFLDSKRHTDFFNTVIEFPSAQLEPQVILPQNDLEQIQAHQDISEQPLDISQPISTGTLTDVSWLKRQTIKRKRKIHDNPDVPCKKCKICSQKRKNTDNAGAGGKKPKISQRQSEKDAKMVREEAVSAAAIHLASAQGNLLKGIVKKTIRTEAISICLLMFSFK